MAVLIGELRNELALEQAKEVEKIINQQQGYRGHYFILLTCKWCPIMDVLVKKYIIIKPKSKVFRPPAMIGTQCWRVDNEIGQVEKLWCLPRDIQGSEVLLADEQRAVSQEILTSAQKYGIQNFLN